MLYLENLFVLFLNVTIIVSPTSARITGPKNPKWSSFSFTVLNVVSLSKKLVTFAKSEKKNKKQKQTNNTLFKK